MGSSFKLRHFLPAALALSIGCDSGTPTPPPPPTPLTPSKVKPPDPTGPAACRVRIEEIGRNLRPGEIQVTAVQNQGNRKAQLRWIDPLTLDLSDIDPDTETTLTASLEGRTIHHLFKPRRYQDSPLVLSFGIQHGDVRVEFHWADGSGGVVMPSGKTRLNIFETGKSEPRAVPTEVREDGTVVFELPRRPVAVDLADDRGEVRFETAFNSGSEKVARVGIRRGRGSIKGNVQDRSRNGIGEVLVSGFPAKSQNLIQGPIGTLTYAAVTRSDGTYEVKGLPACNFALTTTSLKPGREYLAIFGPSSPTGDLSIEDGENLALAPFTLLPCDRPLEITVTDCKTLAAQQSLKLDYYARGHDDDCPLFDKGAHAPAEGQYLLDAAIYEISNKEGIVRTNVPAGTCLVTIKDDAGLPYIRKVVVDSVGGPKKIRIDVPQPSRFGKLKVRLDPDFVGAKGKWFEVEGVAFALVGDLVPAEIWGRCECDLPWHWLYERNAAWDVRAGQTVELQWHESGHFLRATPLLRSTADPSSPAEAEQAHREFRDLVSRFRFDPRDVRVPFKDTAELVIIIRR